MAQNEGGSLLGMKHEKIAEQLPEHEGEKYLRMLGLEHLADQIIPDRTEQVRDFLDVCGEYARPMLNGLECLSLDDPRYEFTRNILRTEVARHLNIPLES